MWAVATAALAVTYVVAWPSFQRTDPPSAVYLDLVQNDDRTDATVALYRLTPTGPVLDVDVTPSYGRRGDDDADLPASSWYFVDGRLIHTAWSLALDSALWVHWTGYSVNRQRLRLDRDAAVPSDATTVTCLDTVTHRAGCTFASSVHGRPVNVSLFVNGPITYVPVDVWADAVARDTLVLGTLHVPGPFAPHDDATSVWIGVETARRTNMAWTVRPAHRTASWWIRGGNGNDDGNAAVDAGPWLHPLDPTTWSSFLATGAVVVYTWVLVYGWTERRASPAWGFLPSITAVVVVFGRPWAPQPSVWSCIGTVWVAVVTAWTVVTSQRSRGGWSPAYGALEGLWALTLYLHDDEPNVVSTAVAGAILATATCDAVDAFRTGTTSARTRTWRTAWTAVALVAFVVDNAFPYVHNHARAVYGLWGLPPTVLATTAVVEGALHLRTPREKKTKFRG